VWKTGNICDIFKSRTMGFVTGLDVETKRQNKELRMTLNFHEYWSQNTLGGGVAGRRIRKKKTD
jgi:hypothetical protein